jgi:hypothetical protein
MGRRTMGRQCLELREGKGEVGVDGPAHGHVRDFRTCKGRGLPANRAGPDYSIVTASCQYDGARTSAIELKYQAA